ncbi:MAG: hypothetical protein A2039_05270 [Candidatus Melainabacteria bacterium GWA2_34_9]|nr:MAG: hypothetical protein A2039_05270 [Candidatus Melainabacteria bacterium GWA2_34_9]
MADVNTVNPLAWNFSAFDYLTPTELRSGNSMPYSFSPSVFNSNAGLGSGLFGNQSSINPFGNYSSIGMGGIFSNSMSLCSFTDTFTAQTAPMIAQAKTEKELLFNQGLYQAQQTSALRDQLRAMGINPDSVLNQNQLGGTTGNTANNQLGSLLGLLGLGGTTGNTSTNQLGSLLGLLGLGGTTGNTANTGTSQLDLLAQELGLGGTTAPAANNSTDQLGSLLGLLGLGGTTTTTTAKPVDDWWNRTGEDDSDDSDDSFWDYIDSKVAQSRQQNQQQSQMQLLLNLLAGTQA